MRTSLKTCFKCGTERPLADYYRHPMMADGHLGKCKQCAKSDVRRHRDENIERIRAYDRERYRLSPARQEQLRRLFRESAPERLRANVALGNAIRSGKVKRAEACWHCGSPLQVEGHHVDYGRPLDVVWLCRSCHCKVHRAHAVRAKEEAAQ